jgi:hypothetical protein
VRFGGGFDSLSVEDESNTTLSRVRPKFGDVTVKIVLVVDTVCRLLHLVLVLLVLPGDRRSLAIDGLAQPGDIILPHLDGASKAADFDHHAVNSILVARGAQYGGPLAAPAVSLVRTARAAGLVRRRASHVGSSKKDDVVFLSAEMAIEGAGALVVGRLERGDGEAERGREWLPELGDGVLEGVEERSFGPLPERVTPDSRKAISISGKPACPRIPLIALATSTALS